MIKEFNMRIVTGASQRFGLGFSIDRYSFQADFLCFFIVLEW